MAVPKDLRKNQAVKFGDPKRDCRACWSGVEKGRFSFQRHLTYIFRRWTTGRMDGRQAKGDVRKAGLRKR